MRRASHSIYPVAAIAFACGCSAPKNEEPVTVLRAEAVTSMAVARPGQTKVVDFNYTGQRAYFLVPDNYYPEGARKAKIQGRVLVEITIDANGKATSVVILSGPEIFHQSTKDYILSLTFKAGRFLVPACRS